MENFEVLIQNLIQPLLSFPNELKVESLGDKEGFLTFEVKVHPSDLGRVIGKNGHIAQAIRTILYAASAKEGIKVRLNIESK